MRALLRVPCGSAAAHVARAHPTLHTAYRVPLIFQFSPLPASSTECPLSETRRPQELRPPLVSDQSWTTAPDPRFLVECRAVEVKSMAGLLRWRSSAPRSRASHARKDKHRLITCAPTHNKRHSLAPQIACIEREPSGGIEGKIFMPEPERLS